TDGFIILQHRYSQKASKPSLVYPSHNPRVAVEVALFFSHIGDVNRSASASAPCQRDIRTRLKICACPPTLGRDDRQDSMPSNSTKAFTFRQPHRAVACPAQLGGVLQHSLENGLKFTRRTADNFQRLRGCGLPFQRLRKFARAQLLGLEQPHVL